MNLLYNKKFTSFYDDLTLSGYYDYEKEVNVIKDSIGPRKSVLELGSGTGNLLIPLAKEGFDTVGIDPSPAMNKIFKAKTRKEKVSIPIYQMDQRKLALERKFDVIMAAGGFVWFMLFGNQIVVHTYDSSFKGIITTFKKTYEHLNTGGLLLLNIQHHGKKFGLKMKNGMYYQNEIISKTPTKVVKTHTIEENGKLIFKRAFPLREFSEEKATQAAKEAGFKIIGPDKTKSFYIFEK